MQTTTHKLDSAIQVQPTPVTPPVIPLEHIEALARLVTHTNAPHDMTTVRMPFTGEVLGQVAICTSEDVDLALGSARLAQKAWAQTSLTERKRIFLRFHDLVMQNRDVFLDLLQLEAGKTRLDALDEVFDVVINTRYYAARAARYLIPHRRNGAIPILTQTLEIHPPVGVVGFIAPWNYPLAMAVSDTIPAMIAGNAVVIKPAEETPFLALLGAELFYQAGVPRDVFQVVTGKGRVLGPSLIDGIDYLGFTGGTEAGRLLSSMAGSRLIKTSMELGGKNPAIVLDDADINKTVDGLVRAIFSNAGQLCVHVERLYIQSGIYDRLVSALVKRVKKMIVSGALDFNVDMGSLISQSQLDKVTRHVEDAVSKGVTVLTGGKALPELGPYFFEPTLLTNVKPNMELFSDETFGPVVAIYRFETVEEAIHLANDSVYGLNACVWTRNTRLGGQIARRIEAGTVNVNEGYAAAWGSVDSPMGGMKDSGLGRRHGREGILKYTEAQTVSTQRGILIGPSGRLTPQRYAAVMTWLLKLMKSIPFLR